MAKMLKWAVTIAPTLFVASCVTYPYTSSFQACDNAAGQCYRGCEDYEGTPDYGRCHADCDFSADRCFDSAYSPYSGGYYGAPPPWYGSYGYWSPSVGYSFSYGSGYYRDPYRPHRPRRPRGSSSPDPGSTPPPSSPPPTSPPPGGTGQQPPIYTPPPSPQAPPAGVRPSQDNPSARPRSPRVEDEREPV